MKTIIILLTLLCLYQTKTCGVIKISEITALTITTYRIILELDSLTDGIDVCDYVIRDSLLAPITTLTFDAKRKMISDNSNYYNTQISNVRVLDNNVYCIADDLTNLGDGNACIGTSTSASTLTSTKEVYTNFFSTLNNNFQQWENNVLLNISSNQDYSAQFDINSDILYQHIINSVSTNDILTLASGENDAISADADEYIEHLGFNTYVNTNQQKVNYNIYTDGSINCVLKSVDVAALPKPTSFLNCSTCNSHTTSSTLQFAAVSQLNTSVCVALDNGAIANVGTYHTVQLAFALDGRTASQVGWRAIPTTATTITISKYPDGGVCYISAETTQIDAFIHCETLCDGEDIVPGDPDYHYLSGQVKEFNVYQQILCPCSSLTFTCFGGTTVIDPVNDDIIIITTSDSVSAGTFTVIEGDLGNDIPPQSINRVLDDETVGEWILRNGWQTIVMFIILWAIMFLIMLLIWGLCCLPCCDRCWFDCCYKTHKMREERDDRRAEILLAEDKTDRYYMNDDNIEMKSMMKKIEDLEKQVNKNTTNVVELDREVGIPVETNNKILGNNDLYDI